MKNYIIAEIGTSHQGDFTKAKKLIDAAANSGADCVKFQWVYAKEILHPKTGFVDLPTGKIPLYNRFLQLEVKKSFYKKCRDYAHSKNLDFGCSPFGIKSLRQLVAINPDMIKIASPELNHFPMLEELCKLQKKRKIKIPVILSSGVSKLEDIKKALAIFEKNNQKESVSLLHCVTSYPAPEEDYNLKVLENLKNQFDVKVGVSDHSLNPIIVPLGGYLAGGQIIEKHITLSNETEGLDDPVALNPEYFKKMVEVLRVFENEPKEKILEYLETNFGKEKIALVLGTGEKKLAKAEKANYTRTNRSIHFMKDLKAGHKIKKSDIGILRTEKILSVGISPEFYQKVLGKKLKVDVKDGEGLLFEHLET